jgi:hypothetical protein
MSGSKTAKPLSKILRPQEGQQDRNRAQHPLISGLRAHSDPRVRSFTIE